MKISILTLLTLPKVQKAFENEQIITVKQEDQYHYTVETINNQANKLLYTIIVDPDDNTINMVKIELQLCLNTNFKLF